MTNNSLRNSHTSNSQTQNPQQTMQQPTQYYQPNVVPTTQPTQFQPGMLPASYFPFIAADGQKINEQGFKKKTGFGES